VRHARGSAYASYEGSTWETKLVALTNAVMAGSINKTVVAFWFGNHDPRTPPPASTCQLTFTVPYPYTQPYVMNAITGTQVPLSSYSWSQNGTQVSIARKNGRDVMIVGHLPFLDKLERRDRGKWKIAWMITPALLPS
jgi:hypothetical protein